MSLYNVVLVHTHIVTTEMVERGEQGDEQGRYIISNDGLHCYTSTSTGSSTEIQLLVMFTARVRGCNIHRVASGPLACHECREATNTHTHTHTHTQRLISS